MIIGSTPAIALAGLRAATARQEQSAYNVANVNTAGFQTARGPSPAAVVKQGPDLANAAALSKLSAFAGAAEEAAPSNTDLETETFAQISSMQAFKANLSALRTSDEMTQSLLNIKA